MHKYCHVFKMMLYWRWQGHRNALLITYFFYTIVISPLTITVHNLVEAV